MELLTILYELCVSHPMRSELVRRSNHLRTHLPLKNFCSLLAFLCQAVITRIIFLVITTLSKLYAGLLHPSTFQVSTLFSGFKKHKNCSQATASQDASSTSLYLRLKERVSPNFEHPKLDQLPCCSEAARLMRYVWHLSNQMPVRSTFALLIVDWSRHMEMGPCLVSGEILGHNRSKSCCSRLQPITCSHLLDFFFY